MKTTTLAALFAATLLAGCQTTQEAAKTMRSEWVGQRADAFFVTNGPPVSSYPLDTGGTIHTWRGGEATTTRPGSFQTRQVPTWTPAGQPQRSMTQTTYQPPRQINYVCEAQITVDDQGIIEAIRISRDSDGMGLSFSRCGELFSRE